MSSGHVSTNSNVKNRMSTRRASLLVLPGCVNCYMVRGAMDLKAQTDFKPAAARHSLRLKTAQNCLAIQRPTI